MIFAPEQGRSFPTSDPGYDPGTSYNPSSGLAGVSNPDVGPGGGSDPDGEGSAGGWDPSGSNGGWDPSGSIGGWDPAGNRFADPYGQGAFLGGPAGLGQEATLTATIIPGPPTVAVTTSSGTPITRTYNPIAQPTAQDLQPYYVPPSPQPGTEQLHCWDGAASSPYITAATASADAAAFCDHFRYAWVANNGLLSMQYRFDHYTVAELYVLGRNGCQFNVAPADCTRIFATISTCGMAGFLTNGGWVESNCAIWSLNPYTSYSATL